MTIDDGTMRTFSTGATRDTSHRKLDPFGFISPLALHRFSEYMDKHRQQSNGTIRDSDNWQKGMPVMEYTRSLVRHVMDFWLVMSGHSPMYDKRVSDPQEIACAILFNVQGYLHETLQGRDIGSMRSPEAEGFIEFREKFYNKTFSDAEIDEMFRGLIRF